MKKCTTIGCGIEVEENELFCSDCDPTGASLLVKDKKGKDMVTAKAKTCIKCHKDFKPTSNRQQYCDPCRLEKNKEIQRGSIKNKRSKKKKRKTTGLDAPHRKGPEAAGRPQTKLSDIPEAIKEKCADVRVLLSEIEELL